MWSTETAALKRRRERVGEFTGAIGVVITLVYLAHQIRQNGSAVSVVMGSKLNSASKADLKSALISGLIGHEQPSLNICPQKK